MATTRNSPGRVALASYIGSAIEWYDFSIYGLAAALVFSKQFFPALSSTGGTLAALASFGVGFFARPLGAVVAGHFGDRIGRKKMLVLSLLTMGVATTAIGVLPNYATIGVWAPILLVVLRLLQGIGVGGEWGGAALMAVEHAPPKRKALYGAFPQIGIPSGSLLAQFVFLFMSGVLAREALESWGWRVPFLLSSVLIIVGLIVRSRIEETTDFQRTRDAGKLAERPPVVEVFRSAPLAVLAGSLLSIAGPTLGSFLGVYMISYGTKQLGLPANTMLWVSVGVSVPWIALMLIAGRLADRVGRKRMFVLGTALAVITIGPMFVLANTATIPLILVGLWLVMIANSMINGAQPAMLTEMFPINVRYTGSSICYQVGSIIGGGILPLVYAAAFAQFATSTAVGVIIAAACAVSLLAVLPVRRTLLDVGADTPPASAAVDRVPARDAA